MENNPLKQYFRRPAVYIALPSGKSAYSPEVVEMTETGELPVYPMTAIDEITSRTPDALFNGTAVTELIKSCVPNIKDPWAINSNDIDTILIGIKSASGGDTMDINSICPNCEESSEYGVNLMGLLSTIKPGDYDTLYETGDLKIKFRPLVYKEMNEAALGQFEVQRTFATIGNIADEEERERISVQSLEKITLLTMRLVAQTIEYVQTPTMKVTEHEFILDFLKHCDRKVYTEIRDFNASLRTSSEIKPMPISCPHCKHEYSQAITLSPTDFFD